MFSRNFWSWAVILVLLGLTVQRNYVWSDPERLWRDTLSKSPLKVRPAINLAKALYDKGKLQESFQVNQKIIQEHPNELIAVQDAKINMASMLIHDHQVDAAQDLLEDVLASSENPSPLGMNALARIYALRAHPKAALRLLDTLVSRYPDYRIMVSVNFTRGLALQASGDCSTAKQAYHTAKVLDPSIDIDLVIQQAEREADTVLPSCASF